MQQSPLSLVADALLESRLSHHPADALPLAACLQTPADAYQAQALVLRHTQGEPTSFPAHWKSGGASRTADATHAPLPSAGVWASPATAGAWPFNMRLIEVEIALRLGHPVSPEQAAALKYEDALDLVDAMAVSIEVVDSRWQQGLNAPALLKLADLQSHGALVLGDWVPFVARDWTAQSGSVRIGSGAVREFSGTHSMADPAWVVPAWLRHATRDSATVPAGTVVTTGTWCGMLPAAAGDLVMARFKGVGEASVQL